MPGFISNLRNFCSGASSHGPICITGTIQIAIARALFLFLMVLFHPATTGTDRRHP